MDNKRILIINGTSIRSDDNTGITVRSIFDNVDIDSWFEITCAPSATDASYKGKEIYALPYKYYPIHYLLNKSFFKKANNLSKKNVKVAAINNNNKSSIIIRNSIVAYSDILPLLKPKSLLEKVEEFKPDCIYTLGASVLTMKLALYFSKKLKIDIVMHFMDNWPDTLYKDHFLTKPCHYLMQRTLKKVYHHMNKGMTISEKMAEEYTRRWGKEHIALMNVVPKIENHPLVKKVEDKIVFIYAGGLHLERWKSLIEISKALKQESISLKKNVQLQIYTSEENREVYEHLFDRSIVQFEDYVEHDSISTVYEKADILIHIESFDSKIIDFTKYSLSTKISEYMASGKPILLYAPQNIAVSEYIRDHKAGLTCKNMEELSSSIRSFLDSEALRKELASNGIMCAKNNHSKDVALKRLQRAFNTGIRR